MARNVRGEVDSLKLHTGIALCRACAPHTPGPLQHLSSPKECDYSFREPLHFIVMSVMVVIFLYL